MRRRVWVLTIACGLAVPASAHAANWTVDPAASAGCDASNVCKTIADANAKVANGDVVTIKDGAYTESGPILVTASNVTFKGTPGKVTVTQNDGKTDTPVFHLGVGTVLDGLVIGVQPQGAEAVVAGNDTATIRNSTLARAQDDGTNAAVLASTAAAGVVRIENSVILQAPKSPGSATPPAVTGARTSSLSINGASIVSNVGDGVVFSGKDTNVRNTVVDSQVITSASQGDAIVAANAADQPGTQEVFVDSSILSSGTAGIAINATSAADAKGRGGPVTVSGVHVTIAGGAVPANASAAAQQIPVGGQVAGPVEVTLDRSIVHGSTGSATHTETANFLGILPIGPTSVAKITITNSDTTDVTHGTSITVTNGVTTPDETLFVAPAQRNYHLRIGSPAIDKAGPILGGESDFDVDLQPRLTGPATDYGADEFVNNAPLPLFKATPTNAKTGQTVQFDGSLSVDFEGSTIAKYHWDFGDGTSADTTTPTTSHVYANAGTYAPKLSVTDPEGNTSAPGGGPMITVIDATPPTVAITTPKDRKTLHIFKTTRNKKTKKVTKTRQQIVFRGTATDAQGVATVAMSLRRASLTKTGTKAASACIYLDKTKFVSKNCKTPVYFFIHVDNDGFWSFRTKKGTIFRAGTYELTVVAKDKLGNVSAPAQISFTLK